MPELELLVSGEGDYRFHDPDALRAWIRDRKRRDFVDETTTAADAESRLVGDGDYVSLDFSSSTRGPLVLIREIIRQRRRNLWYRAKFTLLESTLPVAAGACSEDVVAEMGVKPRVAATVERLASPSARELEILRDQIDPGRTVIGKTAKSR
jgi:glutaconate CoA-transferase subunit A